MKYFDLRNRNEACEIFVRLSIIQVALTLSLTVHEIFEPPTYFSDVVMRAFIRRANARFSIERLSTSLITSSYRSVPIFNLHNSGPYDSNLRLVTHLIQLSTYISFFPINL